MLPLLKEDAVDGLLMRWFVDEVLVDHWLVEESLVDTMFVDHLEVTLA